MNLNLTLIGQMITFIFFVWFTMKFVWPMMIKILQERQKQIADGLAAAEAGEKKLELAEHQATEILTQAKAQAATILEQANHRANHIVEESKDKARKEGDRLLELAQADVEQQYLAAKQDLLEHVSHIAVMGAEHILKSEVDKSRNEALINSLMSEM